MLRCWRRWLLLQWVIRTRRKVWTICSFNFRATIGSSILSLFYYFPHSILDSSNTTWYTTFWPFAPIGQYTIGSYIRPRPKRPTGRNMDERRKCGQMSLGWSFQCCQLSGCFSVFQMDVFSRLVWIVILFGSFSGCRCRSSFCSFSSIARCYGTS